MDNFFYIAICLQFFYILEIKLCLKETTNVFKVNVFSFTPTELFLYKLLPPHEILFSSFNEGVND